MRICYVIDSLYNTGGMERVLSVCANALARDIQITIVTAFQQGRPDYFTLDKDVIRKDLQVSQGELTPRQQKKVFRKRLEDYLCCDQFDVVISLGGMSTFFLHSISDGSKKILWYHFGINIYSMWYEKHGSLGKIKAFLAQRRLIWNARKYDKIVVLSQTGLKEWGKYCKNITFIYNPVTISKQLISDTSVHRALAVGRLDFQKGFDYLIDSWKLVKQKYPDWKLDIYGGGDLKYQLQDQINQLGLNETIFLCGVSNNIAEVYQGHGFLVMSSRQEGFPLTLLEASSCGLPLVAFDCHLGPNEIIEDGINGYLVKNVGDIKGLSEAICRMIENDEKRCRMGQKAKEMIEKFSIDSIRKQWIQLVYSL